MTRRHLSAALGAIAVAGLVSACSSSSGAPAADSAADLATSKVERQDLKETATAPGELGYGDPHDLLAVGTGTATWLPRVGQVVGNGGVLYRLNDQPVMHLDGTTPAWRDLGPGVSDGDDVLQLERALTNLGYADGIDVDGEWTAGTTAAVKAWQDALGLKKTGVIPFGQVSFGRGGERVAAQSVRLGTQIGPGVAVLSVGGTRRLGTTSLDADQQALAPVGSKVEVSFEDGSTAQGTVRSVKTVDDPSGQGKLEIVISFPKGAKLAKQDNGAQMSVLFTHTLARKALTVPVTALVALSGGGYAVQVVADDGSTSYVPVTPGAFADDQVELTDGAVKAGDNVVVTP